MPQRNVASNFTFEQQRVEINNLAQDFWTHKGDADTAAPTYLKHDGSNAFTGQTLAVPNAFTINSNSGNGTVTISGNLDVTGTTTTVSSANLEVTDKNILIAKGSTSDSQADGAGITIDSATDITFNFVDAKDALVSSIGLEATTFVKAARGQFTGSTSPTTGQGVEINAPDANTGQISSYDRGGSAYKELRVKGSSVGIYAGTVNALVGTFNSTGLSVTGTISATGTSTFLAATEPQIVIQDSDSGNTGNAAETSIQYKDGGGTLQGQIGFHDVNSSNLFIDTSATSQPINCRVGGSATQLLIDNAGIDVTGTITASDDVTITGNKTLKVESSSSGDYVRMYAGGGTGKWDIYGNGANLRFSDNESAGSVVFDRDVLANSDLVVGAPASNTLTHKLLVQAPGDANAIAIIGRTDGIGELSFYENDASTKQGEVQYRDTELNIRHRKQGADINFATTPTGGTMGNRFIIASDGNISNECNHTGNAAIFANTNTTAGFGVKIKGGGTTADRYALRVDNAADEEKFRVNADGMVGIGVNQPAVAGGYAGMEIGGSNNTGLRLSTTSNSGWAFTDYEINGSQKFIVGCKGGTDSLSSSSSWRICSGASLDSNQLFVVNSDGSVLPGSDNSQDLGSTSYRWANLYTGDLNLCNEGSCNEVDGTSGSWTMQEGDSDLFLINRKSGKKYKFNLTEVS